MGKYPSDDLTAEWVDFLHHVYFSQEIISQFELNHMEDRIMKTQIEN